MATFVKLITMDLVGGLTRNGYQAKSESVYAGSKKKGTLAFTVSPVVQAISGLRSAMKRAHVQRRMNISSPYLIVFWRIRAHNSGCVYYVSNEERYGSLRFFVRFFSSGRN